MPGSFEASVITFLNLTSTLKQVIKICVLVSDTCIIFDQTRGR
jgi:hypothetical protein